MNPAGRMRIRAEQKHMTLLQADILEAYLRKVDGVVEVSVCDRTRDAVICYKSSREAIKAALGSFPTKKQKNWRRNTAAGSLNREYQDKLVFAICQRAVSKLFFPLPLRTALSRSNPSSTCRRGSAAS